MTAPAPAPDAPAPRRRRWPILLLVLAVAGLAATRFGMIIGAGTTTTTMPIRAGTG